VGYKAQIGTRLHRDNYPSNAAVTRKQPNAVEELHSDLGPRVRSAKHPKYEQQVLSTMVRKEISPEVEDWLSRVVLPSLKKVIF
jgi:hypothetical protein